MQSNRTNFRRLTFNIFGLGVTFLLAFLVPKAAEAFASKTRSADWGLVSSKTNTRLQKNHISVAPIDPSKCATNQQSQQDKVPVLTQDVVDLADLRYNEWIKTESCEDGIPSQHAFRMATAEIAIERSEAGAIAFLARLQSSIAVGAAELSPAEFEGAILEEETAQRSRWYVTDVVTSSIHRRMGIANRLMDAMERYPFSASGETPVTFYLHVKSDNDAAMAFYQNPRRGYAPPTRDELVGLDVDKLAINAGTEGQILLCKTISSPPLDSHNEENETIKTTAATGFGGVGSVNKKAKKKKPKRKNK